jgi:uncharacterized protein with FMN-binding domain
VKEKVQKRSSVEMSGGVVAASFAAVVAVYLAGYIRTESAAERFASQIEERRPAYHASAAVVTPSAAVAALPEPQIPESIPQVTPQTRARVSEPRLRAKIAPPPVAKAPEPASPSELRMAPEEPPASAGQTTNPSPASTLASEQPAPPVQVAAATAPASPSAQTAPAPPVWKDGTYTGWGYSRHGDIEAQVVIQKGRIISAGISQCRTRYSCDVIEMLPPQVVERQSPEVDYVTGATQSADAFYGGVVAALNNAK